MNEIITSAARVQEYLDDYFDSLHAKVDDDIRTKFKAVNPVNEGTLLEMIQEAIMREIR